MKKKFGKDGINYCQEHVEMVSEENEIETHKQIITKLNSNGNDTKQSIQVNKES
jgi:hypothetical protein